jgi:hypothetical protein
MKPNLARLVNFFRGKKTYLVSAATLIYGFGIVQGLWKHQPGIDFLLTGSGLATVRGAIGKLDDDGAVTNSERTARRAVPTNPGEVAQ